MIQHCGRVRLFLALPSDLTAPRPSLASVGLEVFQKGHAIGLRQVRTPEVATIAVAGPRGVDETVLLAARCVDGKATGSYSRAPSANVFGPDSIARVVTPHVPAGTALLADFDQLQLIFQQYMRMDIDAYSGFDQNAIRFRAESFCGIGILRPQAFAVVTLS